MGHMARCQESSDHMSSVDGDLRTVSSGKDSAVQVTVTNKAEATLPQAWMSREGLLT